MWKSLSNKQKFEYSKEFKGWLFIVTRKRHSNQFFFFLFVAVPTERISEYMAQMREYKEKLSDDDKKRMKEMKAKIVKRKASLITLRNSHRLGKPKKPINSYLKFFMERWNQVSDERKHPKAERNKFFKDISIEWLALSDAERAKYHSSAEWEAYL